MQQHNVDSAETLSHTAQRDFLFWNRAKLLTAQTVVSGKVMTWKFAVSGARIGGSWSVYRGVIVGVSSIVGILHRMCHHRLGKLTAASIAKWIWNGIEKINEFPFTAMWVRVHIPDDDTTIEVEDVVGQRRWARNGRRLEVGSYQCNTIMKWIYCGSYSGNKAFLFNNLPS